jgi:protein SCO1/2
LTAKSKTRTAALAQIAGLTGVALALCLAGCTRPVGEAVPNFELTNWDGRKVSNESLKGKRTILTFTYAKCILACPMITFQLKSLDEELASPPDLSYVHVSVNPTEDTPEEILAHFEKHEIDPHKDPRWLFLGGPEERVAAMLDAFDIEVTRKPVDQGVLIEHTNKVMVLNRDGRAVAVFDNYHWDKEEMKIALQQ